MKKKSLFLGLLFAIFALAAQAQIVETYRVGFESSGEAYSYTVQSGTATPQSTFAYNGQRALRMQHTNVDCVVLTDTIDFTQNSSFAEYMLEFRHVCNIYPNACSVPGRVGIIEAKMVGDPTSSTWVNLSNFYESDGGSSDYLGGSSFSERSYPAWRIGSMDQTWWHRERFNLKNFFTGVPLACRKLQLRITLYAATTNQGGDRGWYIDDIIFRASPNMMNEPKLTLASSPEEMMPYPTSRAARIDVNVSTNLTQGLDLDSVYMYYKLSNAANAPVYKQTLSALSTSTNNNGNINQALMRGYIPFAGYDTIISWRIVAKDANLNHNTSIYPERPDSWAHYYSTRGYANQAQLSSGYNGTLRNISAFPFAALCAVKSEFVYTADMMRRAGYSSGAITNIAFTAASAANHSPRQRLLILMANVDDDYTVSIPNEGSPYFRQQDMKAVYDSAIDINQNANTAFNINLQDTFFYAGRSLLMQVYTMHKVNNQWTDPQGLTVKAFGAPANLSSLYQSIDHYNANASTDPINGTNFQRGNTDTLRPDARFTCHANLPLIYDCGISGFVTPNDTITADANTANNITVTLTNYGVAPINQVTIYFQVDGGITQSYNWTGTLAGGASTPVTVTTTQNFSQGYHEMLAWVEDSIISGTTLYRDHEPLNDTCWTKMVSCLGPMSGNVQVGGTGADYQNLEKFLYTVSRCGVGGALHVKLAPGTYDPFVMPIVPGASAQNYIQFEPLNGQAGSVQFTTQQVLGTATPLVDLRNSHHIRFSKISFVTTYASNVGYPVRLGIASTGCQFLDCLFDEVASSSQTLAASTRAVALLYSGGADSLVVDGCTFNRGTIGVSMVGPAADNLASGAVITRSVFNNQGNNNLVVRNHIASVVDSNVLNNLLTGAGYQMLFQDCHGAMRITRNTAYVTSGASCLGVTDFYGTAANTALIANNMLVCADDGTATMLTTPMLIIKADYTKIVHNSVKLTAPTRSGIAAATFGGDVIDHCYFYNNIVSCFDTANYAFSYVPSSGHVNYIGYNIYYSRSYVLNKYDGSVCTDLLSWNNHVNDAYSQQVNPAFLCITPTDLSTYSLSVKGHGLPFSEVPIDINGTARDTLTPCVGAFEFANLPYEFEIVGLVEPYEEYCNVPASAPLRVMIKNNGVNEFVPGQSGNLQLTWSRTTQAGVMTPGHSGTLQVNTNIPGNSTAICNFNANLQFPTNGLLDTTYTFYLWLTSTIDLNHINDTSAYTVTSRFHPAGPTPVNTTSPYGTAATVAVNQGIMSWNTQVYNSGRHQNSEVYWYADSLASSDPIHRGNSFTTPVLYQDTTYYVRQKRELPIMRITEVQIKRDGDGATFPLPMWLNSNTAFAVELTNVGDYPANLLGDTLMTIGALDNGNPNSGLNNKVYVFPNITIQPGQSFVLQWRANSGGGADSTITLGASTVQPQYNSNFAVIYRDKHGIADAVAFNNMGPSLSGNIWSGQNVPAAVWSGNGIPLQNGTAGAYRTAWPTQANATPSNTAQYWQVADATHIMGLGETNPSLVRYTDNGCLGDPSPVHITLTNLPPADIALDSVVAPTGCGLGMEPISVGVHNFGAQNSGEVHIHCSVDGVPLCTDTISNVVPSGMIFHTFSQLADLSVNSGSHRFNIRAWVDPVAGDNTSFNDSISGLFVSSFTPEAPLVKTYDTVQYAGRLLLSSIAPTGDSLRWYDRRMIEQATTNSFLTPHLFRRDTFFATALAIVPNDVHIGTLAATNNATAYPSPLNPNKKFGQEQYLFKASELHGAGHQAGPITAISFYLDTVMGSGSYTIDNFSVGIGTTAIEAFNASNPNTKWQTINQVYTQSNLTLSNAANKGWIRFEFSEPFHWDGQSNIVVGVIREMSAPITAGAKTRYTTAFTGAVYQKNDGNAVTISAAPGNGSLSANRPDILFEFQDYGCEGPASPIYITVEGNPSYDVALEWPADYDTTIFTSCGTTDFDVMVLNNGTEPITNISIDYWVDGVHGNYVTSDTILFDSMARVTIATPSLVPGRHVLSAAVAYPGDTIPVNDTITRTINVRFCSGNYTIGTSVAADYPSFQVALDTLYAAGVAGAVVFNIESGVYTEQLTINAVEGSSRENTITFRSATGNATDVKLTYSAITAANNHVINIDGAEWMTFDRLWIDAEGPAVSSNAIKVANSNQVHFVNCCIEVKATNNNANSNAIILNPGVQNILIDSCTIKGGYFSVRGIVPERGTTSGVTITHCQMLNFWSQGVALRKIDDIIVRDNEIRGGVTVSARPLTGITVAEVNGGIDIERNNVVLFDNMNGGKRPIVISNCIGTSLDRGRVFNNMCVAQGTGANGGASQGITIDSSLYLNVYYNSVRVYAGASSPTTRAFSVDHNSAAINVYNNIFSNFSKGYAYWLNSLMNVAQSNYNVLFSDTTAATKKLARIGQNELVDIDTLRLLSGREANSLFDQPYFVDANDLHLAFGLYSEKALYLPDVTNDIDLEARPAIPAPCIGADEYQRCIHNVAIMQFLAPTLETDPNPVESDTLKVVLKLFNDGTSTETNLWWRANIVGHPELSTPNNVIAEMAPSEIVYATSYIVMPMGIIDTNHIEAFFSTDMLNDCALWNNSADTVFFIDMAYDLMVTGNDAIAVTTDVGHGEGCRLWAAPVTLTVTNKGRKPVPVDIPFTIGYEVKLPSNANYTVAQIPIIHEETFTLSAPIGVNESAPLQFATPVNIYPTGNSRDISVRIRGWVSHPNDQKHVGANSKDSTATAVVTSNSNPPWNSWKSVSSKYLPSSPVGVDLHIPYGTWDTIHASQSEAFPGTTAGRPIRWYRDSTDAEPYHAPAQYARSCWWETPQYYHDSTYYLSCISASSCTSYYSPVHVILNPRVQNDVSIMSDTLYYDKPGMRQFNPVTEPYDKVYMTNDTVKVHIVNYGSTPVSNVPVYYQLRRVGNNQVLQEVREVCTATIQPDSLYLFSFDSLVELPYNNAEYTLRLWTDLASDPVHVNDTIRHLYSFRTLPESAYETPSISNAGGIDIIHVSFSSLCNDIPEVGHVYNDFARIDNPEVPVLKMIKGTTDTMMVEIANSEKHYDYSTGGFISLMIDFDRDGVFDNTDPETALSDPTGRGYTEIVLADTITCHHRRKFIYTIPDDIALGYMRMRLVFQAEANQIYGDLGFASGNVQDYLLYIEDVPEQTDLALSRLVTPASFDIRGNDSTIVTIQMSNKGATPITSAEINYSIIHGTRYTNSINWTGDLQPGMSTTVALPARWLGKGSHNYTIWTSVDGDTIPDNDTLRFQLHRFDTVTLILRDDFETDRVKWYAPHGYNDYTHNVWQRGVPNKVHLNYATSDSSVLATHREGLVAPGQKGNLSYFYTPLININQIRPDTLSFSMAASMGDSMMMWVEFLDYESRWRPLGTGNDTLWYNSGTSFVGRIAGRSYMRYSYPISKIGTDVQGVTQFRLVFLARPGAVADDGVVIDDIVFGRARRSIDVGVVSIVHPTQPRFGEIIYPKVAIKNYGTETINEVTVAYRPYGSNLPKTGTYRGSIEPGESKIYEFLDGFTVMADFPDTFDICAFTTVNMDIYWENDSTCKEFGLSPLDNDMALTEFIYPLDRIVAGDSIEVTVRMRNYGQAPVTSANVTYLCNGLEVTENVDFAAALPSGALQPFEYYSHTFRTKCRAIVGTMNITAFVDLGSDDYRFNDTITKNLSGISSIVDLKARAIFFEKVVENDKAFLMVDNVGALGVTDFEIGFYLDLDTSTTYRDTIHIWPPLASLDSRVFTFGIDLPQRIAPNGYFYASAWVHELNDNDRSNDTTTNITKGYVDMKAHKVIVEENRSEECRVRMLVENVGSKMYLDGAGFTILATINGESISRGSVSRNEAISPFQPREFEFNNTIAKSHTRHYVGTGTVRVGGTADTIQENNTTDLVEVVNYFENIPLVDQSNGMLLDQNYPNPFDASTRIDFYIPTSGSVRFFVMDVMGRLVYQSEQSFPAGDNSILFQNAKLTSGVYYYGIEKEDTRLMRKMVYKE